jgi:hypothetical protein
MTKAQLKAYAARRSGAKRAPSKANNRSKAWKERNPHWYRGRNYVRLLSMALVSRNANAKVFKEAGMPMVAWVAPRFSGFILRDELLNGSKLVPVKSWREFNLDDKEQVKAFLAPGNFRLVQKDK